MSGAPPPTLSIDLGTTTIVAALARNDADVEVVFAEPSTVSIDGDTVLVGEVAQPIAATRPDATVQQLIRRLGDSSPVVLDGRAFSVVELFGHVVSHVAATANLAVGLDPAATRLVLTHPAGWRDHRLDLLASVGRTAGFATVDLVSEPIAAVRSQPTEATEGTTLIVDVGGGTVDATLVRTDPHAIGEVVSTQSLERLGGSDFDQAVFTHVSASVDDMIGALDRRDPAVRAGIMALRSNCSSAKERLSSETDASIELALPGLNTTVRITRAEFESLIRPQIDAVVALVDRVLSAAGLDAADLAAVVVVGGSAPIPLVAEMLAGHLGRGVAISTDSAAAVALGAATSTAPSLTDEASDTNATPDTHKDDSMNDNTNDSPVTPTTDTEPSDAAARRTPMAPPPPGPSGPSTGTKVAAGAAAAAAAVAAGVIFGDDIAAALDGDDTDAGMDEFDAVAAPDSAGPAGVPLDEPTDASVDSPTSAPQVNRPTRPSDRDDGDAAGAATRPVREAEPRRQREATDQAANQPTDAAATAAASASESAAAPAGAAAAATATPTATPTSTQPVDDAGTGIAEDAAFEAARATLLERLDNFEAPPGTSPEDAAALRQELADAVEAFQPLPGQSTEEALAAMRDDFDDRVQDFVQDQKIETLVREVEEDNQAEAAAEAATEAAPDATVISPETAPPEDTATPADTATAVAPDAPDAPDVDASEAGIPTHDTPDPDASTPDAPVIDTLRPDFVLEDDFDAAVIQFETPSSAALAADRPLGDVAAGGAGAPDTAPAAMVDVVGESVYTDVVETTPLTVYGAPVVEPVAAAGVPVEPVSEVPQIPEGFEHPVYIEPEPIDIGQISEVADDAGDFRLQGIEDEGDLAVLQAEPDVGE